MTQHNYKAAGLEDFAEELRIMRPKKNAVKGAGVMGMRRMLYVIFRNRFLVKCQRYRGEGKWPRREIMTLQEMAKRNVEDSKNFIKHMDTPDERPLWAWKPVSMPDYQAAKEHFIATFKKDGVLDMHKVAASVQRMNEINYPDYGK